jgi:membrane protein
LKEAILEQARRMLSGTGKALAAPWGITWRGWGSVFWESAVRFVEDDCFTYSAAISYYFMLSFFPLVLILLSFSGFVLQQIASGLAGEEELYLKLLDYLHGVLPFLGREMLGTLTAVVHGRQALGLLGLGALLISSTAALGALEQALRRIFGVSPRHFIVQRLLVAAMVFGMGFLLAVSIFLTSLGTELLGEYIPELLNIKQTVGSFPLISYFTPLLLLVAGFVIVMKYFMGRGLGWGITIGGGAVFATLFTLARVFYHIYLSRLSNLNALYGSLTAVVALVLWVFYLTCIMLFSGEFIRTVRERKSGQRVV